MVEVIRDAKDRRGNSTKQDTTKRTVKRSELEEEDQEVIDIDPTKGTISTRKTKKHNHGKLAEGEVRQPLEELLCMVFRINDTRNYQGSTKTKMMIPKVKADFDGYYVPDAVLDFKSRHYYLEVKSSKSGSSFPMKTSIVDSIHQWQWAEICWEHLDDEYWYFIVNRHSPTMYYILVFDWMHLKDAMQWMVKKSRKSIPWEKMKNLANGILIQDDDCTDNMRFVTDENIEKLKEIMDIQYPNKEIEYEY